MRLFQTLFWLILSKFSDSLKQVNAADTFVCFMVQKRY